MSGIFSSIDTEMLFLLEGTLEPERAEKLRESLHKDEKLLERFEEYAALLDGETVIREESVSCPEALTDRVMGLVEAERELALLREVTGNSGVFGRLSVSSWSYWLTAHLTPRHTMAGILASLCLMIFALSFYYRRAQIQDSFELVTVLVPAEDIQEGRRLTASLFRSEVFPRGALPPHALTEPSKLEGRYARSLLVGGQPLAPAHLSEDKPAGTEAAEVQEGFRAIAFPVSAEESEALTPGLEVGIIWTTTQRKKEERILLVRRAAVISVGKGFMGDGKILTESSYANLLVSESDAAKIDLARRHGSLTIYIPQE